ncbi:MAG: helix-turn-helix domain-containing protein [Gammaproteobacteria bacterium]
MVAVEQFSTAGLRRSERLSFWNELALSTVGPISIDANGRDVFEAKLSLCRLAEFEFVSPTSSPAIIRNRAAASDDGMLNLSVQVQGRCSSTTDGETCMLECGDFVLYDPTRPLECRFPEPIQQIVLRLPQAEALERIPCLSRVIGVRMRGDVGGGVLLTSFIRNAWNELCGDGDSEWAQSLGGVLWPLLDLAYRTHRLSMPQSTRAHRRWGELLHIVDTNLREPAFGTRELADKLGVSTRYIQMLFAEIAITPSAFIQNRRLELAAGLLERRGAGNAITDLAYDVGFSNLSTFCRAFRRKYQMSPSDYRKGLRAPRRLTSALA